MSRLSAQQADELRAAYQREAAYLDAQAALLRGRIEEAEREGTARIGEAERKAAAAEARLLSLHDRERELSARLADAERRTEDGGPVAAEALADRAAQSLSGTWKAAEGGSAYGRLSGVLEAVLDQAAARSEVRTEPGTFFLPDGNEARGSIVRVGGIAAFGVSERGSGNLAPLEDGEGMRLVGPETAALARRLAQGKNPERLRLFLYDTRGSASESSGKKTLRETVRDGGIVGVFILCIGAASVVLVLLRFATLRRSARGGGPAFPEEVLRRMREGSVRDALEECGRREGAAARVAVGVLRGLASGSANTEEVLSECLLKEQTLLDRYASAISVFVTVSPLLGLLGTVTGMIKTFTIITEYGNGDPRLLSGGISEALVTTEFGLFVAIPLLLVGTLLTGWADRIAAGLETTALRITSGAGEAPGPSAGEGRP